MRAFLTELRRRRVFRTAALYVVGAWAVMQAADILFPAWGIAEVAINYLLVAAIIGFPVALVFGWLFDISMEGIRRTQPVSSDTELRRCLPLRRADYVVLSAFLAVVAVIVYDTASRVMETTAIEEWRPTAAEVDPQSVAVLPFADLSPEQDQEYFTDGISEEILNRLSAFRELKVIARTSSFAFKDSGYDVPRISGLLAVQYLLQGSVRRDGKQLRIAAQLIDHRGVQVWSSSYDRELGGIFALQDEIAEAVASSIVPQIVPPTAQRRLPDLEAYEAYLTGREIVARREYRFADRALAHYQRAIELDPEFAEVYAERAVARVLRAEYRDDPDDEFDRAQRDIDRALALKPDLARAYAAQALLMQLRAPDSRAAREALLRKSLTLDPNQVDSWNWLYSTLSGQGRSGAAEEALGRALRLDPLAPSVNANMAMREIARGAVAEAEQRLLRVLETPLAPHSVYETVMFLYIGCGRLVEAIDMAKRYILSTVSVAGQPPAPGLFGLIGVNAMLGRQEQAEHWRARNVEVHPQDTVMRVVEWSVLVDTGALDHAEALARFEETVGQTSLDFDWQKANYGKLLALSGNHEAAIRVLEPLFSALRPDVAGGERMFAAQALAWSYLQVDDGDKAGPLLERLERDFRASQAAGGLVLFDPSAGIIDGGLAGYATAKLLSGDEEGALALLAEAAEAGWRGYYAMQRDPRWKAVRDRPEFRTIMATVKADIDRQRARLEAIEAEDDFETRFDAARSAAELSRR